MSKALTADSILPYALLGMTAVTGLVDAVSFLSLGHVFTANMTGNIVLLAFASTGVPQVSLARSITALLGFLAGADWVADPAEQASVELELAVQDVETRTVAQDGHLHAQLHG